MFFRRLAVRADAAAQGAAQGAALRVWMFTIGLCPVGRRTTVAAWP